MHVVADIECDHNVVTGEFHTFDAAHLNPRDRYLVALLDLGGLRELGLVSGFAAIEAAERDHRHHYQACDGQRDHPEPCLVV